MEEDNHKTETIHKKAAAELLIKEHIKIKRLAIAAIIGSLVIIPINNMILVGAIALPLWMYSGILFNQSKQEIEFLKQKYDLQ